MLGGMPGPDPLAPADPEAFARCLRGGGVIAYPTEAVWGLGCDPFNEAAVLRLLRIKQRPVASTSANRAGEPAATSRGGLDPALLAQIDAVLAGEVGDRPTPSTIRDARTGAVLRA